ncbi:MAG: sodium:proton antiporter NhaD [Flavobacteriales bacterium]
MITLLIVVFVVGYAAIAFEQWIGVNKAATALITGVGCWTILSLKDPAATGAGLAEHFAEIGGILFFLLGAMTIVELIAAHNGFDLITDTINLKSKRALLWTIALITFFLSAVLDNLTTAIVMVTLLRRLITDRDERIWAVGLVVIAANAGGAWSPIGDVTTTMLWIKGQITTGPLVLHVFVPSLACVAVPLLISWRRMSGTFQRPTVAAIEDDGLSRRQRRIVLFAGIGSLLFVPVFKTITHLPPVMGILLMVGVLWIITELIHGGKDEEQRAPYTLVQALRGVDTPTILFFLGILLSVSALQSAGVLAVLAQQLGAAMPDVHAQAVFIGLVSAVVDNVPLVAAAQGMYAEAFATDHTFWILLAYCAGTGGSVLIIGSAAGVAAMGMERIGFFWYAKRIGGLALAGYLAGAGVYLAQRALF